MFTQPRRIGLGVSVVGILIAVAVAAEPEGKTRPTSNGARAAILKYDGAVAEAKRAFEKDVARSRDELVRSLTAALDNAMERKDLDEANRIKSAITDYKAADPAPPADASGKYRKECDALGAKLTGTTWQFAQTTAAADGRTIVFNKDGSAMQGKDWLRWTPIDGRRIVLIYASGSIDTLTFNDAIDAYKQSGIVRPGDGWGGRLVVR